MLGCSFSPHSFLNVSFGDSHSGPFEYPYARIGQELTIFSSYGIFRDWYLTHEFVGDSEGLFQTSNFVVLR